MNITHLSDPSLPGMNKPRQHVAGSMDDAWAREFQKAISEQWFKHSLLSFQNQHIENNKLLFLAPSEVSERELKLPGKPDGDIKSVISHPSTSMSFSNGTILGQLPKLASSEISDRSSTDHVVACSTQGINCSVDESTTGSSTEGLQDISNSRNASFNIEVTRHLVADLTKSLFIESNTDSMASLSVDVSKITTVSVNQPPFFAIGKTGSEVIGADTSKVGLHLEVTMPLQLNGSIYLQDGNRLTIEQLQRVVSGNESTFPRFTQQEEITDTEGVLAKRVHQFAAQKGNSDFRIPIRLHVEMHAEGIKVWIGCDHPNVDLKYFVMQQIQSVLEQSGHSIYQMYFNGTGVDLATSNQVKDKKVLFAFTEDVEEEQLIQNHVVEQVIQRYKKN